MRVKSMLSVLTLALLMGYAASGRSCHAEELDLDFSLVNSTGYTIKEVYIAPNSSDEWGSNIMEKGTVLKDGQVLKITFHPKATAAKWDLRIVWADDGKAVVWHGYKLTDIEKITLKYDEATDKTTAVTE
jgi:hypothetical protein